MSIDLSHTDELEPLFHRIRRPLLTEEGRELLDYLYFVFCERRIIEVDFKGKVQRKGERYNSVVPGDPYATHELEGCRKVVLFLKDLQEMEG